MKKMILKTGYLLSLFLCLLFVLPNLFNKHRNATYWDYIYNPEHKIDLLTMGASHSFTGLNPSIIDSITKLNSYNLGSSAQNVIQTYFNLVEVLKYKTPKIIIFDLNCLITEKNITKRPFIYDNLEELKLSYNKIQSILNTIPNQQFSSFLAFYIKEKFNPKLNGYRVYNDKNKGYYERPNNKVSLEEYDLAYRSKHETIDIDISKENLKYFLKYINLCKKNNIELILLRTPILQKNRRINQYTESYFIPFIKEYDLIYYNFDYYYSDLNLQYEDYYDLGHMSKTGSRKISIFLSHLLIKDLGI